MKEFYTEPTVSVTLLAARERLTAELDFDDLMAGTGGGVSADPDIDIDVPIN